MSLPRRSRRGVTLELRQHGGKRLGTFAGIVEALPVEQEAHEIRRRHRLDLAAQLFHGIAMDAREQAPFAPFGLRRGGAETPLQHETLLFQFGERAVHLGFRQSQVL